MADRPDETETRRGCDVVVAVVLRAHPHWRYRSTAYRASTTAARPAATGRRRPPATTRCPSCVCGRPPSALASRGRPPLSTLYAGEIDGTDEFIPNEQIAGDIRLADDKDAEIILYCRSGRMSEIAEELVRAGSTNLADLEGAMDAWQIAGMSRVRRRPSQTTERRSPCRLVRAQCFDGVTVRT